MTDAPETPPPNTVLPVMPPDLAPKPGPETMHEPASELEPETVPGPAPEAPPDPALKPELEPVPDPVPKPTPDQTLRRSLPWLAAAAFLILAVSQAALWVRVLVPPTEPDPLDQRVQAIEARLTTLEHRPPPTAPGQPTPASATGATSTPPDLGPLEARIAALEQRPPPSAIPNPNDSFAPRLTADEARLATLEKAAAAPAQLADRANRIARIQSALVALSAGQPLGALPGAPPALARYANTAPPTEAALRLAFPAASQAALAADHPAAGKPFLERIWAETQDLVTIRQGEHVLVGDPAAGILAHAQTALDAGDLAGAAASVATLTGPAAQALAPWLDQAHGLLAARAALADLAAQT